MDSSNILDHDTVSHEPNTGSHDSDAVSHDSDAISHDSDSHEPDYDSYFGGFQDRPGYEYPSRNPTPPIICNEERHPFTLYSVKPWSSLGYLEYGGIIQVLARSDEECCDILKREKGGCRFEIEHRVRNAQKLWLASSDLRSGIWMENLH